MNASIETSLREWLLSTVPFADSSIHTGQSAETIPGDAPVIFCACETVEPVALGLYKVTAQIVISTPCVIEESLPTHQALSDALKAEILDPSALVDFLPPSLHLAGAVLNSFTQSTANERWLTSSEIVLGLTQI
jgi:hypothetical protein